VLAGNLQAAVVTDCKSLALVQGRLQATKMICGGAIGAEYVIERSIVAATVTPGVFAPAPTRDPCPVLALHLPSSRSRVTVIEEVGGAADAGPLLKQAAIVVSGGLGVGGREHWSLVTDLANALGAAVGATRAVVESGWADSSHQVGYSGVKVAPDLYLAVGISGAVHHLAGVSQAKTIVAINTDATAEIFKVARFGVVGDAKTVVPALIARLRELRNG
jgi:electron transfer flavoprotein alpha subunit